MTIGTSLRRAARYAGVATYPPNPMTACASISSIASSADFTAAASRPGSRSRSGLGRRGSGTRGMGRSS
jgi:hypothetical protein